MTTETIKPICIGCIVGLVGSLQVFASATSEFKMSKYFRNTLYNLIGIALGVIVYIILAPGAYAARGYFAIGGEGLLGYMIAWIIGPVLILNHDKNARWFKKTLQRVRDEKNMAKKQ